MTPQERLDRVLSGRPADRPPFSFWYHFGQQHRAPSVTAELHASFQRRYGVDLLKVMNDYDYPAPSGREAIRSPEDLDRVEPLSVGKTPLRLQLDALALLRRRVPPTVPLADTVFCPWTALRRHAGARRMRILARESPERMGAALQSVAETLAGYVREVVGRGVWGVFYSVVPSGQAMSRSCFSTLSLPADRRVLEAARRAGAKILIHLHGRPLYVREALALPHDAVSWSAGRGNPSLRDGRRRRWSVVGGVDEERFSEKTPPEVRAEVRRALKATHGAGHLLAPGCALPTQSPPAMLDAIREAAERWNG